MIYDLLSHPAVILMEGGIEFDLKALELEESQTEDDTSCSRKNSQSQPNKRFLSLFNLINNKKFVVCLSEHDFLKMILC